MLLNTGGLIFLSEPQEDGMCDSQSLNLFGKFLIAVTRGDQAGMEECAEIVKSSRWDRLEFYSGWANADYDSARIVQTAMPDLFPGIVSV